MKKLFSTNKFLSAFFAAGECLLISLLSFLQPVMAETITIGKGSGIIWEGMPFDVKLNGPLDSTLSSPRYGLLSISAFSSDCTTTPYVKKIAGYTVYPIAPGIGLTPRAIGTVSYYSFNEKLVTINATLGIPETRGLGENSNLTSPPGAEWCIPSAMVADGSKYSATLPRTANIRGSWILVSDGTQKSSEIKVPQLYAGSFAAVSSGDRSASILPANITLRISNLDCTVNTPTQINFGPVAQDLTAGAELGVLSYPFITQCNQDSDRINANINLQFRAVSGLYQNSPNKLSLNAGGGYITGEIDNGVTGSGSCTNPKGVPFDNQAIRIGSITSSQSSLILTNQVTWRLCSGGKDLPLGNVDATAEMLVTFN